MARRNLWKFYYKESFIVPRAKCFGCKIKMAPKSKWLAVSRFTLIIYMFITFISLIYYFFLCNSIAFRAMYQQLEVFYLSRFKLVQIPKKFGWQLRSSNLKTQNMRERDVYWQEPEHPLRRLVMMKSAKLEWVLNNLDATSVKGNS